MSELTLAALAYAFHTRQLNRPGERLVYDDGHTQFYVIDPPALLCNIGRTQARYLTDPRKWADVLSDFATDQACRAMDGKLTHACFDALAAGDTAQFGALVANVLRPKIQRQAEDDARDAWGDEHDERHGRGERMAVEYERRVRAESEGTP